jgi:hypothetical protein
MRVLAFVGSKAETALDRVLPLFRDTDAKVRKAAVITAASIKPDHPDVMDSPPGIQRPQQNRA